MVRMDQKQHEEDSVPSGAYYGMRTKHARERVTDTGRRYKTDLLAAMARLLKAAARAETTSGALDPKLGALLERAAQEVADGRWHDQFLFEPDRCGSGALLTRNMNEVLANRAIELLGEERGSYHILGPDWHAESPLYPNRYFTAAFQLAALDYAQAVSRIADRLPGAMGKGVVPVLDALAERLGAVNRDHFDPRFVAALGEVTGRQLRTGRTSPLHFETAYDAVSGAVKNALSRMEPALQLIDSAELKAVVIQVSAFHDMIAYMVRSGFQEQGLEEITACYAWQCLDLFCQGLLKIDQIYH